MENKIRIKHAKHASTTPECTQARGFGAGTALFNQQNGTGKPGAQAAKRRDGGIIDQVISQVSTKEINE